jgi:hypothetical protein
MHQVEGGSTHLFIFLKLEGDNIMIFVLVCSCGCRHFDYNEEGKFVCTECGEEYNYWEAGGHLLGVEDDNE